MHLDEPIQIVKPLTDINNQERKPSAFRKFRFSYCEEVTSHLSRDIILKIYKKNCPQTKFAGSLFYNSLIPFISHSSTMSVGQREL